MNLTEHIAKQFREVYFGGNWTGSNLKQHLQDISWQQATFRCNDCNTIAALVFHMNYYVSAVLNVLKGNLLDAHDNHSFDHPPVHSEQDWNKLLDKTWKDAEEFASLIDRLPESRLWEVFSEKKYGDYYRNIQGIIDHTHYHLGQIVLLKKMVH
jgi:uncharacterized damage-inducible protein DinB